MLTFYVFQRDDVKKRISIWTHGGVGSGLASQGQPVIMRLIQYLATQYHVDVYSLRSTNDNYSPQGFSVHSPPKRIGSDIARWFWLFSMFRRSHKQNKYHCVYAFWGYPSGVVAYFIGKLIGCPAILHLQGGDSVGLSSPPYGIFRHHIRGALCRFVYNRCSRLIALTKTQSSFLVKNAIRRQIDVVPYGVDEKIFSFRTKSSSGGVIRFLHVGNLTPIKGQEMLMMTFLKLREQLAAELIVVGPDYDNGSLIALSKNLGVYDSVRFAGHQLYHDLPSFYHDAHVLIHTSVYEGQGVVFAEAASCGTLLAGTKVGMLEDMGDSCGIRVDYGHHEELAHKILNTLRSAEATQLYIRSAKAWVHERDEQLTFRSVKKIIDETIIKH